MENKVYRDEDVSLDVLKDKVIAVLGYGIQGGPQAQCFRDCDLNVIVGAGPQDRFPDWDNAAADGFEVMSIAEATKRGDVARFFSASGRSISDISSSSRALAVFERPPNRCS